jgi:hypothetical protein
VKPELHTKESDMTDTSLPALPAMQYVAVPTEHVPAVYRLLAQLAESRTTNDTSPSNGSVWTDALYERFARGDVKTTEIVGEVMDLLAEEPETLKLSIDELAERTGYPRSQMKTVWTHLSRHVRTHYGTEEWPLETAWGTDLTPPRPQVIYYFLTAEQADQWRRARAKV